MYKSGCPGALLRRTIHKRWKHTLFHPEKPEKDDGCRVQQRTRDESLRGSSALGSQWVLDGCQSRIWIAPDDVVIGRRTEGQTSDWRPQKLFHGQDRACAWSRRRGTRCAGHLRLGFDWYIGQEDC